MNEASASGIVARKGPLVRQILHDHMAPLIEGRPPRWRLPTLALGLASSAASSQPLPDTRGASATSTINATLDFMFGAGGRFSGVSWAPGAERKQFRTASPFPHAVFDGAFPGALLDEVDREFPDRAWGHSLFDEGAPSLPRGDAGGGVAAAVDPHCAEGWRCSGTWPAEWFDAPASLVSRCAEITAALGPGSQVRAGRRCCIAPWLLQAWG